MLYKYIKQVTDMIY